MSLVVPGRLERRCPEEGGGWLPPTRHSLCTGELVSRRHCWLGKSRQNRRKALQSSPSTESTEKKGVHQQQPGSRELEMADSLVLSQSHGCSASQESPGTLKGGFQALDRWP